MKSIVILSAACFMASAPAFAETSSPAETVSSNKTYFYGGIGTIGLTMKDKPDAITEDITPNLSLGLGHEFSEYIALETFISFSSTEYSNEWNPFDNTKIELSLSQIGVSVVPSTGELGNSGIKLYARLNASMVSADAEVSGSSLNGYTLNSSDTGAMLDGGVGIQWNINDNFMIRGEYLTNLADSSLDDFSDYFDYQGAQIAVGYRF